LVINLRNILFIEYGGIILDPVKSWLGKFSHLDQIDRCHDAFIETNVRNLKEGIYKFKLAVYGNHGAANTDLIQITVKSEEEG